MLVVDTSVLVYASGVEHPLREPAIRLFRDVAEKRIEATTTPEVLQEYAHVRGRRDDRARAVRQAERFAGLLAPLTIVSGDDVLQGLRMWSEVPGLGAFDAVLGSVASTRGWPVVSSDRGFSKAPSIEWIDLADY